VLGPDIMDPSQYEKIREYTRAKQEALLATNQQSLEKDAA
jgi:hypothetical protein